MKVKLDAKQLQVAIDYLDEYAYEIKRDDNDVKAQEIRIAKLELRDILIKAKKTNFDRLRFQRVFLFNASCSSFYILGMFYR